MALRDSGSHAVACRTTTYPALLLVREAEAMCLLEALSWLLSMGFKDVIFETVAQVVVNAIKFPKVDLSEFGSLISSCVSQLNIELSYSVSFVKRQANKVVETLARAVCFYTSPTIWMTMSSFRGYLICNDCNDSTGE
ncbi:hypothetical protein DITRI_Ditri05aG0078200 [Diplodiscus trichospermus]